MTIFVIPRRAGLVLGLVLAVLLVPFAAPIGIAHACGCGAYSPQHGGTASVPAETALVRSTGDGTEDVYLSLTVDSSVRSGALLFPVPDKHATVSAGPRDLFTELDALTAPRPQVGAASSGNGAAAPAPQVTVENRQQIGPLDVVTLSSGDPAALTAWLSTHGFAAKPALTAAARPYTSAGWAFVAVRLRPGAASAPRLDGRLDPLHLHFASKQLVYPMRLSALAAEPERVVVYTLARHRLDLHTADPGMAPTFAQRISADAGTALASVTSGGTTFLAKFDGTLTPATITDDFRFTPAAADSTERTTDAPVPYTSHARNGLGFSGHSSGSDDTGETVAIVLGVVVVLGLLFTGLGIGRGRRRLR